MLWELANIKFYLQNPKPQRIGGIKLRLSVMDHKEIRSQTNFLPHEVESPWKRKPGDQRGGLSGSRVLHEEPCILDSGLRPSTPLVWGREDLGFASGLLQISRSISWEGKVLGVPEHRGAVGWVGCSLRFQEEVKTTWMEKAVNMKRSSCQFPEWEIAIYRDWW